MTTTYQSTTSSTVHAPNGSSFVLRDYNDVYTANGHGFQLGAGALVTSLFNYGFIWADDNGVEVQADNARITNFGTLTSFTGDAINLSGGAGTVEIHNHGTIMASDGEVIDIDTPGAKDITLVNAGIMVARGADILFDGALGRVEITNTGLLDGAGLAMNGSGAGRLFNSGEIFADLIDLRAAGGALLVNRGTLTDRDASDPLVRTGDLTGDRVVNAGVMLGAVDLGGGADFFDNAGTGLVSGLVSGAAGADTLVGGDSADQLSGGTDADKLVGRGGDDDLSGGAGDDTLLGGAGNDTLSGGEGDDTLTGNSGDDVLTGSTGRDLLVGQDGSDILGGGEGDDILDGGNGDDALEGGSGNDILRGRAGEDDLAGGLGGDLLTGGQGADTFVFRSIAETVVGASRDQILDFEPGLDLIVVAGLSPGVFEFRGKAGFVPSGNPELRLFETATGSTIVQLDANGDGTQDAEIRVANVTGLTEADFAL